MSDKKNKGYLKKDQILGVRWANMLIPIQKSRGTYGPSRLGSRA